MRIDHDNQTNNADKNSAPTKAFRFEKDAKSRVRLIAQPMHFEPNKKKRCSKCLPTTPLKCPLSSISIDDHEHDERKRAEEKYNLRTWIMYFRIITARSIRSENRWNFHLLSSSKKNWLLEQVISSTNYQTPGVFLTSDDASEFEGVFEIDL